MSGFERSCENAVKQVAERSRELRLSRDLIGAVAEAIDGGVEPVEVLRSTLMVAMDLMRRAGQKPTAAAVMCAVHLGALGREIEAAVAEDPSYWAVEETLQ